MAKWLQSALLMISIFLMAFLQSSANAERGFSRYGYRSQGQSEKRYYGVDPEGRYTGTQGYRTEAQSNVQHGSTTTSGQHRYDVNRGYDVYRDGRPVQSGSTSYRGGSQNNYSHNGSNAASDYYGQVERGNAYANQDTAKRLQLVAGAVAESRTVYAIYMDKLKRGEIPASKAEVELISSVMGHFENLYRHASRGASARTAADQESSRRGAHSEILAVIAEINQANREGAFQHGEYPGLIAPLNKMEQQLR